MPTNNPQEDNDFDRIGAAFDALKEGVRQTINKSQQDQVKLRAQIKNQNDAISEELIKINNTIKDYSRTPPTDEILSSLNFIKRSIFDFSTLLSRKISPEHQVKAFAKKTAISVAAIATVTVGTFKLLNLEIKLSPDLRGTNITFHVPFFSRNTDTDYTDAIKQVRVGLDQNSQKFDAITKSISDTEKAITENNHTVAQKNIEYLIYFIEKNSDAVKAERLNSVMSALYDAYSATERIGQNTLAARAASEETLRKISEVEGKIEILLSRGASKPEQTGGRIADEIDKIVRVALEKHLASGIKVDKTPNGNAIVTVSDRSIQKFGVNSARPPAMASKVTRALTESLVHEKFQGAILVVGHADERHIGEGADAERSEYAYNFSLSRDRARAIASAIASSVATPLDILFMGVGSTAPIAPNQPGIGAAINRRVDIMICGTGREACLSEARALVAQTSPTHPGSPGKIGLYQMSAGELSPPLTYLYIR